MQQAASSVARQALAPVDGMFISGNSKTKPKAPLEKCL